MGLLHRLFNLPPNPNDNFIVDKYGEKFWIYWHGDSLVHLSVIYRGRQVGEVKMIWDHNDLIIGDIIIFPRYNLRKRRLGKAMMGETIHWAKEQGAILLEGWLQPDELTTEDYLVEWYRRQGFTITENKRKNKIAQMSLK